MLIFFPSSFIFEKKTVYKTPSLEPPKIYHLIQLALILFPMVLANVQHNSAQYYGSIFMWLNGSNPYSSIIKTNPEKAQQNPFSLETRNSATNHHFNLSNTDDKLTMTI